jgi:ABC-type glycerol-3-phosphate transport system permease component
VIVPLSVPGLITAGLSTFVFQWNAFFWPLTVTKSAAVRVVQVGISLYFTETQIYYNKIFAAAVLSALPTILLYAFLQRYFIRSVSISGIK